MDGRDASLDRSCVASGDMNRTVEPNKYSKPKSENQP